MFSLTSESLFNYHFLILGLGLPIRKLCRLRLVLGRLVLQQTGALPTREPIITTPISPHPTSSWRGPSFFHLLSPIDEGLHVEGKVGGVDPPPDPRDLPVSVVSKEVLFPFLTSVRLTVTEEQSTFTYLTRNTISSLC